MGNTKSSDRSRTHRMTRMAVCTAIIAACSQIVVPMTVPFTMQTFAVFLTLLMLGATDGMVSIALYILLGAVGAPVFAGLSGGIGRITGPTGGFIVGFFVTALCCLIGQKLRPNSLIVKTTSLVAGLALCYCFGALWFAYVASASGAKAFALCVLPFIIPDLLKLALAVLISQRLRKLIS